MSSVAKRDRNPKYGKVKQDPDEYFRTPRRHIFGVSGYLLFSSQKREEAKPDKITVTELGHMWSNLSEKEKAKYNEKADKLRDKIYEAEENLKEQENEDKENLQVNDRKFASSKAGKKVPKELERVSEQEDLDKIDEQTKLNKILEKMKRLKQIANKAGKRGAGDYDYEDYAAIEEELKRLKQEQLALLRKQRMNRTGALNDLDDLDQEGLNEGRDFDRKKANSKEAKAQLREDEKLDFNPLDISTGSHNGKDDENQDEKEQSGKTKNKGEQKDKGKESNATGSQGQKQNKDKQKQEERSGVKPKKDQKAKERDENEDEEKGKNEKNEGKEDKEEQKENTDEEEEEQVEEVNRNNQSKLTGRKPKGKATVRLRKDGKVDRRTFGGRNVGHRDIDDIEIKDDNERTVRGNRKNEAKEEMKQIEGKGENFQ